MKQKSIYFFLIAFFCFMIGCATGGSDAKIRNQDQADAYRKLGEAYLGEQNYTSALSQFLKAEKLVSDDYILEQDLGIAYMAKNDLQSAVLYFKKALEIKPDYAVARNNLGAAYLAMKDWNSAIENFKMLTTDLLYVTPQYPLANLGKAYYEKKDYAEAEKYYQEALKTEPGFVNALYGLGKTYLAMGEVKKASGYFEQAMKAAPARAEVHFDLAETYRLLGDKSKAKNEYGQVITLAPDSEIAKEAKQELSDMGY